MNFFAELFKMKSTMMLQIMMVWDRFSMKKNIVQSFSYYESADEIEY